jgi:glyoxylase-like metal-dependent hydrolase (beta-lactamase superfamily II)
VPDPVLGDTELTVRYSGYQPFGPLRAPTRITQSQGGFPIWDITGIRVDTPDVHLVVPDSVATATAPPVWVSPTRLAPGVWHLGGGITHSVAVEFPRYVAVIEAPTDEARSIAVLETIRTLIPAKPVQHVVTTHHHFDHIGGLRTYVARGAAVMTHVSNVPFLSKSLVAPATIQPDAQSGARRKPRFEPVVEKRILGQRDRVIEVYSTKGGDHTNELLIAYLPRERILVEADSYSPAPPIAGSKTGYLAPPNALALWNNIQRLGLDVRTVAPIHGSGPVSMAEFAAFVGK